MQQIQTELIIDAPAIKVWETLMAFSAYPEWNPFVTAISGKAEVGQQMKTEIQLPGQKGMKFSPRVLVCESAREFRWLGKLWFSGLFDGEHYFQLEAINVSQTRFLHGEKFSGLLTGVLLKMIGENTRQGFIAMNQALKDRVELN